jgi:excisionase family DNA binding protein
MEPIRLEALLEAVRAVQESVSELERELMSALAQNGLRHEPSAQPSEETSEWLTLANLSVWLKVSKTTAYQLVSSREIPSYRIGRSIRVRRKDVERWLEGNRQVLGD